MDAARAAVWSLELVTSPDRAAAIVGDLAEESAGHRGPWFWIQVAQTLLAHIVREFTSAPSVILTCFLRSIAYLFVAIAAAMGWASLLWFGIVAKFIPPSGNVQVPAVPDFAMQLVATPLLVRAGWMLAEKTKRPIAAAFVFAIVTFLPTRNEHALLPSACALIGAIWQRRRALSTA